MSSTWQVALIREQDVEFGIVVVQDHVIDNPHERESLWRWWTAKLGRPIALLSRRQHRAYGRRDIVGWLDTVHPSQLPWRQMTTT